jgi:glycerol-3-phosphate acyltransferase PlsY
MAKGAAAVALAQWVLHAGLPGEVAAGVAAILGHVFPVFIGFRGGRGVATSLGAMLVISPIVGVVGLVTGVVVIALSKVASLGSLLGAGLALAFIAVLVAAHVEKALPLVYCLVATLILALTHRDNIQRLASGTERKIHI